jgi:hypothetical protein
MDERVSLRAMEGTTTARTADLVSGASAYFDRCS